MGVTVPQDIEWTGKNCTGIVIFIFVFCPAPSSSASPFVQIVSRSQKGSIQLCFSSKTLCHVEKEKN